MCCKSSEDLHFCHIFPTACVFFLCLKETFCSKMVACGMALSSQFLSMEGMGMGNGAIIFKFDIWHITLSRDASQKCLTKIWESQKLVIKKVPSSQIPFFTYKLLAKFCFEACQIRIIRTHPNSSELPNLVIQVTQITKYLVIPLFGSLNNRIFSYSVIWVTQNLVIWVTQRKPKKPNLVINLEVR
jgi:hypothetical protein